MNTNEKTILKQWFREHYRELYPNCFNNKYVKHFGIEKHENIKQYEKEYRFWLKHKHCSWEKINDSLLKPTYDNK